MEINLVTVTGTDPILLYHYIKHYTQLGVDNFYIVIWGSSDNVKYDETLDVLNSYELTIYKDYRDVKIGDAQFLTDIYNEVISTKPDDWWIQADHDEFVVLDKPLKTFVNDISEYAYGVSIDRIGKDGEFSKLYYEDDIWEKFPNVGFISRYIRNNDIRNVPLLKGKYKLTGGQHSILTSENGVLSPDDWKEYVKGKDCWPPKIQVHHFKWRYEDIETHKQYIKYGKKWCSWENEMVLDYMLENKKINIRNSKFLIEKCPNNKFNSYTKWHEVIKKELYPAWS